MLFADRGRFTCRYPTVRIADFKGERSCNSAAAYNRGREVKTGLGDVRQLVAEYCILPLLKPRLHECAPYIKSVMITGPR